MVTRSAHSLTSNMVHNGSVVERRSREFEKPPLPAHTSGRPSKTLVILVLPSTHPPPDRIACDKIKQNNESAQMVDQILNGCHDNRKPTSCFLCSAAWTVHVGDNLLSIERYDQFVLYSSHKIWVHMHHGLRIYSHKTGCIRSVLGVFCRHHLKKTFQRLRSTSISVLGI